MSKKDIKFKIPRADDTKNRWIHPNTKVEYIRTFALWKCIQCNKRWHSAYTWLTLNFIINNKNLYKAKRNQSNSISADRFKGPDLKGGKTFVITSDEYLKQHCKSCTNTNVNNQIIYYSELRKGMVDTKERHRAELCAKCLNGYPCKNSNWR